MTTRKKTVLIILPSAAVLLAIAAYFCFRAPAEPPLPPEQQIRHDFRKAFDPEESTLDRLYSLRRSFKEVRGLPADRRHRIMVEALAGAMDSTLQDFAQRRRTRNRNGRNCSGRMRKELSLISANCRRKNSARRLQSS